jgi:flagellar protein FlaE
MTLNPRDYDLDELRKMARERGDSPRGPPSGGQDEEATPPDIDGWDTPDTSGSSEKFQSGLYRELLPLEAGAGSLEKPYLTALPESYAAEFVVFEWLEFLVANFGYQGANEALQYYESVGWLTGDVETRLNDYLLGIEDPESAHAKDGDIDDHKLSLVYIARLVSMR